MKNAIVMKLIKRKNLIKKILNINENCKNYNNID